jgi:hypothetical protein
MILQKLLSGRPSKLTPEMKSKIIRAVREGASFSQAAISAGTTFVSIYRWRAKDKRFDKALRTARKQAVGKGRKVGEVPMIRNAFGELVVTDIIDAKEQGRLQRAFDKRQKELRSRFFTTPQKRKRLQPASHDQVINRLIKVREEYEAELQRKKVKSSPIDGNVVATPAAQGGESTDLESVQNAPVKLPEASPARPEPPAGVFVPVDFTTGLVSKTSPKQL